MRNARPQSSGLILWLSSATPQYVFFSCRISVTRFRCFFLSMLFLWGSTTTLCRFHSVYTLQCCTIEVYRLLYTSIYYKLLWLYNLFVRVPAPYKCSDQTRTICVNTKAERHVVAKSGDNTIPLPFNVALFWFRQEKTERALICEDHKHTLQPATFRNTS